MRKERTCGPHHDGTGYCERKIVKLQILIPLLALFAFVNGCRSTSDTQAKHPAQTSATAPGGDKRISGRWAESPICLSANNLSIATGQPSLVLMSSCATHIPVWSLSGITAGQSVAGLVTGLPNGCAAVKVEIVVTTTDAATSPIYEDVYRCHLSQMAENASFTSRYVLGTPVRTALPAAPCRTRTIVLESYYPVEPNAPLWVLDEPFVALDTAAIAWLAATLAEHIAGGGMAILTSHQEVLIEGSIAQHLRLIRS